MCTISEHMEDIIGLVFKYLRLLKEDGIHEWIFDEVIDRYVIHLYYLVKFFDGL
jgi:insulysin